MKVVVDRSVCQNHGQCALVAETVFRMDEAGELRYDPEPDDALLAHVEEAADLCPVQAIRVLV